MISSELHDDTSDDILVLHDDTADDIHVLHDDTAVDILCATR